MKKYLILILFFNISFSQDKEFIETEIGSIFFKDSICFKEMNRAKNDIQSNIFHYFVGELVTGEYGHISFPIFKSYLSNYNINVSFLKPKTFYADKHPYCYEFAMNKSIEKKFGKDFIENNLIKAKKAFTLDNPDLIILDGEKYISSIVYPNTKNIYTQYNDIENDVFKKFETPFTQMNYKLKTMGIYTWFLLRKDGKARNIKIEIYFYEFPQDKKYFNYYKKHLIKFIKKTKWIPLVSNEVPLDKQILLYFNK